MPQIACKQSILEQLLGTSTTWLGERDEATVLNRILQGVAALGFDRARLYLLSEDKEMLIGKAHIGMGDSFLKIRRSAKEDPYLQELLSDCSPHLFTPRPGIPLFGELWESERIREWVCAPLLRQGQVIGKLSADNIFSGRPITQEDRHAVALLAGQAAAAIESVQLLNEVTRRAEQLAEQHQYLASLIESSPNAVITSNFSGHITGVNKQAWKILGYLEEEDFPSHVHKVYYNNEEADRIGQLLAKNGGSIKDHITFLRSRSGERIQVRISATTFYDSRGQRLDTVGYFEDMRSFRALENRVQLFVRISFMIAQAEQLTEGLSAFAELLVSLLSHTFCRIILRDERADLFVVKAVAARYYPVTPFSWTPQLGYRLEPLVAFGSPKGWSMKEPQVLDWRNPEDQSALRDLSIRLELLQPVKFVLRVPLGPLGKPLGFLEIGEKEGAEGRLISAEEQNLVSAAAAQASVFIERLQQLEKARRETTS